MPRDEAPTKKNWFGLITDNVLVRSGPGRIRPTGADVYAGQPMASPDSGKTVDVYGQVESQVKR